MRWPSLLLTAASLAGCAGSDRPQMAADTGGLYAHGEGEARRHAVTTLIFVLHGDAPDAVAGQHYVFAREIAGAVAGSRAIALLRPGYGDVAGNRSPGEAGTAPGSGYTRDRITAVAQSIAAARARYPDARTVVVGQDGGAVIAANLAGLRPELVDAMVLVGCPCLLPEWRRHIARRDPAAVPDASAPGLDPLMTVGGIAPSTRVALLVGNDDPLTPPRFSRAYAEALALRGIATDYRVLPGRGHEILDDPEVLEAVRRLAAALPPRTV